MIQSFLITVVITVVTGLSLIGGFYLSELNDPIVYTYHNTVKCYYAQGDYEGTSEVCACIPPIRAHH